MIGPGRWGSSNIDLGVNVGYADIDNAAVLVELAREEAGHVPEVSYGTHFFQDLVEQQIIYLPVYPDDADCAFNEAFFETSPERLTALLPERRKFEEHREGDRRPGRGGRRARARHRRSGTAPGGLLPGIRPSRYGT